MNAVTGTEDLGTDGYSSFFPMDIHTHGKWYSNIWNLECVFNRWWFFRTVEINRDYQRLAVDVCNVIFKSQYCFLFVVFKTENQIRVLAILKLWLYFSLFGIGSSTTITEVTSSQTSSFCWTVTEERLLVILRFRN